MTLSIILTLAGYFVFAAAVGAMSTPTEEQKRGWYGWLYRFLQRLAANADRLAEARFGSLAGSGTAAGELAAAANAPGALGTRTVEATSSTRETVSVDVGGVGK